MKYGTLVRLHTQLDTRISDLPRHRARIETHGELYAFQGHNRYGLAIIKSLKSGAKISVLEDWIDDGTGDAVADEGADARERCP